MSNNISIAQLINSLGELYQTGRWGEAEILGKEIIAKNPDHIDLINLLGTIACQQGNLSLSIEYFEKALQLQPNYAAGHVNLGIALHRRGDFLQAIASYHKSLNFDPNNAKTYLNLSVTYAEMGKIDTAIAHLQMAIAIDAKYAPSYFNLGNLFKQQKKMIESISYYQRAIEYDPSYVEAHCNLAHALLITGNFLPGFIEYEWRTQHPQFKPRHYGKLLWDGSPLEGKTILVYTEQGFGDAIEFCRYLPLVKERGGQVILECEKPLVRLFSHIDGIDMIICAGDNLPPYNFQIPLMSLPRIFKTTLETIPANIPYFKSQITRNLSLDNSQLKIGIVWETNRENPSSSKRSCSLKEFSAIFDISGVNYYSLQKDITHVDQILLSRLNVEDLSQNLADFADTAAVISALDLIITVDTAVAHLAGAMGKEVWVLLPLIPDWRWLLDRSDTPWYPTMRLFRQQSAGDWVTVCAEIKQELSNKIASLSPIKSSKFTYKSSLINLDYLGITWPINPTLGWGVYGLNLVLQLSKISNLQPICFAGISPKFLHPLHQHILKPIGESSQKYQQLITPNPTRKIACQFPLLFGLGNQLAGNPVFEQLTSELNIGMIFFEDTNLGERAQKIAEKYPLIITGSHWNRDILKSHGIHHVITLHQGIDPMIFHPAPKPNLFSDKFVIFSGGKLEYRKGQDIVVAAFKRFYQHHRDALLLVSWDNLWPEYMTGLETTGNVIGLPKMGENQRLDITTWLGENGLPNQAFFDIGLVPNYLMGQVIINADVALFPNRGEGGTNLVAMECMACGIPTILSGNTGHLDLISDDNCYILTKQKPVKPTAHFSGVQGWGESDVDEIVEILELIYYQRDRSRGEKAALFMQDWIWEKQVKRLQKIITD